MNLLKENINKIVIFRALQLGDLLCSVPAFRALRNSFPNAHIALAGLPWAESFMQRFAFYLDSFLHFPGYPGLPEQLVDPENIISFLALMQKEKFDLVLQMQGNGTIVNPLMELFGARFSAGFCVKSDYCPDPGLYLEYPEGIAEIERHLALMNHIGVYSLHTDLEFPLSRKDEQDFEALKLPIEPKKYVCIHPGSRGSWRQWPPAYFAALGDYCTSQGLTVVLTGTQDECEIVLEVMSRMKQKPLNTAGRTSLGAVGVLIKNAFALISNCTGVSHMASAFKTNSIVISMDGEPERWAPLNKNIHRTIDWTKHPDFDMVFAETKSLLLHAHSGYSAQVK